MTDVVWTPIEGVEHYLVSNEGFVMHERLGRLVARRVSGDDRLLVTLSNHGKTTTRQVSRLVAEAYVENLRPGYYTSVAHKDGDLSNCHADNLVWMWRGWVKTYHELMRSGEYDYDVAPFVCEDNGKTYTNPHDAARELGMSPSHIMRLVRFGPHWKFTPGPYRFRKSS